MWCRRNPVLAGASGLVAATVLAVAVLSLLYAREQTRLATARKLYGDEQNRRANEQAAATAKISAQTKELEKQGRELEASLVDTNRRLAMLFFERARHALDGGQVNHGLLWLVECWRHAARADDRAWQHLARANLSFWRYHCPEVLRVFSHGADVHQIAFGASGKTILTRDRLHSIRLWDARTGLSIGQLMSHPQVIFAAALSPDERVVLTGSFDNTARLWHASNGQPMGPPLEHSARVFSVAFSPDGRSVLTGAEDGTARLWEVATGRLIVELAAHDGQVEPVAYAPDGKVFLTMGHDDRTAKLWDSATAHPIGSPMELGSIPAAGAFSPDGKALLTSDFGGRMQFWDVATARPIRGPLQHEGAVLSISYSADGKTVATRCFQSHAARLWDATSWLPIGRPLEHQGEVESVAFSPDDKMVLTGGSDRSARLWDAATGQPIGQPMVHPFEVSSAVWSPDGKHVLTGSGQVAWLWDILTGLSVGQPLQHPDSILSVAYDPAGRKAVTVAQGSDRAVRLWDTGTGQPIGEPMISPDFVAALAFSRDGTTIITAGQRHEVRRWDATTGRPIGPLIKLGEVPEAQRSDPAWRARNRITFIAYSPDGRMIITREASGKAGLWDATSFRRELSRVDADAAAFSPDGKTILTWSRDEGLRRWDSATGEPVGPPLPHPAPVSFVGFSPDGKTILAGGGEAARLWDAGSARPIDQPILPLRYAKRPVFSPDGRRIIAGIGPAELGIWDVASGRPVGQAIMHQRPVLSLAFSPDGRMILTGCSDNGARLWDAATGQPIGPTFLHPGPVHDVAYSPDGRTFLTAGNVFRQRAQSTARLWHVPALIDDDLPRIEAWVETFTALEVDDQGNIVALDSPSREGRRELLRELGGPPRADSNWLFDPILYGPDPTARARAWIERGQWSRAEAAFDEAVRARPLRPSVWAERGRFHMTRSDVSKAAADFARAMALGEIERGLLGEIAADGELVERCRALLEGTRAEGLATLLVTRADRLARRGEWARSAAHYRDLARLGDLARLNPSRDRHQMILALTCAGDRGGLRQESSALLGRSGDTTDPFKAGAVAWSCVMATGQVADPEAIVRLAEFAWKGLPEEQKRSALNTLGAALYRAGRFREAINRLEEGVRLGRRPADPLDWPFLAMAHHRLGHRDEARRWLDRLRNRQASPNPARFWDELEIRVLRSDAEAVILYDPVFPTDLFAH
jgi:WD40 repeat protein